MEIRKESIRKMFPHLCKELEGGEGKVEINSIRTDPEKAEEAVSDEFRHYDPTVVDFIRRCDTETEAEAIINFLEKRRELTGEYAEQLRKQLKKEGVRSFGSKKEEGYYFTQSGFC